MLVCRRMEVDAGHRLLQHEGRCAHVHGHRYAFEVAVESDTLDAVGRVVDFGVVRDRVGAWLDDRVDHAMLVEVGDPIIPWLVEHQQRHLVMGVAPTAENLARLLYEVAREMLPEVTVVRVRCWETPSCWAEYP